jgi:hypothetical protein
MPLGANSMNTKRVPFFRSKQPRQVQSPKSLLDLKVSPSSDSNMRNAVGFDSYRRSTITSPPIESDDDYTDDEMEIDMLKNIGLKESESAIPLQINLQEFLSFGVHSNSPRGRKDEVDISKKFEKNSRFEKSTYSDIPHAPPPISYVNMTTSIDFEVENELVGIERPSYDHSDNFAPNQSPKFEAKKKTPSSNNAVAASASATRSRDQERYESNADMFLSPLGSFQRPQQYHRRMCTPNHTSISATVNSPSSQNNYVKSSQTDYTAHAAHTVHGTSFNIENDGDNTTTDLTYIGDNERFITPGQVFMKKERSLPNKFAPEKGSGLGITPPPTRSKSSRLIVPYVNPPSNDKYTIFILVIQPSAKLFELVRVNYHPATATIKDLLDLVPGSVTEEHLKHQKHIGFCRPKGSSSSSRSIMNACMTASVMARDGTCARILCGELLIAIPEDYSGKEVQMISSRILSMPKMQRLLSKSDPIRRKVYKGNNNEEVVGSLGIQPISKNSSNAGTFPSSSILFCGALNDNGSLEKSTGDSPPRRTAISLLPIVPISPSNNDACSADFDLSIVNTSRSNDGSQGNSFVGKDLLEAIKLKAIAAAKIAAEKAFAEKIEELVSSLDFTSTEKDSLLKHEIDTTSFNSAFLWAPRTDQ